MKGSETEFLLFPKHQRDQKELTFAQDYQQPQHSENN